MADNQTQKNPSASQPAGSQNQKKPEGAPKDNKSSFASDNKTNSKDSTGGSSSGAR